MEGGASGEHGFVGAVSIWGRKRSSVVDRVWRGMWQIALHRKH